MSVLLRVKHLEGDVGDADQVAVFDLEMLDLEQRGHQWRTLRRPR